MFHKPIMSAAINPFESEQRAVSISTNQMRPEWLSILSRVPGDGLKGSGFPHHVLGILMHNPDTFGVFMDYWVTSKQTMALSVREQELVILRMGVLFKSDYVWKHHVIVGREFGISEAEMDALISGQFEGNFDERETALLTLTDEMINLRTVLPGTWRSHGKVLPTRDMVDLISLVSQYVNFALLNNVMQVQVEEPVLNIRGLG